MNSYYDIHCPFCGNIMNPLEIKFSLSEFVEEIYNLRLDEKYNDGVVGEIDEEEINIILDNDFLWDMSVDDIHNCYMGDMFVLSGDNLIKRFGSQALDFLHNIPSDAIDSVINSTDISDALDKNEHVKNLVRLILSNISRERLIRTEVPSEDRDIAVLKLIQYAKTNKVLFKICLKVKDDQDDHKNVIYKDIRSEDERIICKSKRCCKCGNALSKMAGKYEEKIISFIGSPAAGKSAYLAAAIHKLFSTGQSEYGIEVIFDYQSSDYIAFDESCYYPYSKGFAITKTNQGTFPQLTIALKNSFTGKTYLYTFVDIPGETFIDENGCNIGELLSHRRIIKYADIILYCVSAKQLFSSKIGRVRRAKNSGVIENEEMSDLRILGSNTIKFASEMFAEDDKIPAVAIVLTKSDLISNFIMENVFSGDAEKNRLIKSEYFKTICSVPQDNYYRDEEFDYYDGEPNNLGYIKDGRFMYQKFMNEARRTADFIKKYGELDAEFFLSNVSTAFKNLVCPCFSEASYGRNPVEKYSMDNAVRYLLSKKDKLFPRDYDDLKDIFGENELSAFESGEGKLPVIREQEDIKYIQNMYRKYNPIFPFGIMSILEWAFAYTGLVECVEHDGENWNVVPTDGEQFENLKLRLIHKTPESDIHVVYRGKENDKRNDEEEKGGWFSRKRNK